MSTCTRKVLTTLAEKGHEAQFQLVDIMKGEQKKPEFTAMQPFGVVPVLDDDGFILYESRAIIRYLDQRLAGARLIPQDLKHQGLMDQWISVEQSNFTPQAMKIIFQNMFYPMMGKEPDLAIVEQARGEVARVLDIVEKTLSRQEYLAPSGFSLAEISWMPYVQYLFGAKAGDLITSRPGTAGWWERISTRPSWKKVAG
jgi:glutathione S-transferase